MKTIIAGSRSVKDFSIVETAIKFSGFLITEVFSGSAHGVDSLGEEWAIKNKIAVRRFPAQWEKHGKSAGFIRNTEMGDEADALIAIWDGKSRGTKHMVDYATKKKISVFLFRTD